MKFRPERVGKLIREELSLIILHELDFHGALVTLTDVEVDKKLDHALVKASVIPSERAEVTLALLQRSEGHLQHLLWKKINIKPMPRISFAIDHGFENAAAVEKVFQEVEVKVEDKKEVEEGMEEGYGSNKDAAS